MSRRAFLRDALSATLMMLVGSASLAQQLKASKPKRGRAAAPKNIRIRAAKYAFSPNHITIYQNEQVVLDLTSADVVHGFAIPDMGVRNDVPPGQPTMVTITPQQTGDFAFLCDTVCGDGHDRMQGRITVVTRPA